MPWALRFQLYDYGLQLLPVPFVLLVALAQLLGCAAAPCGTEELFKALEGLRWVRHVQDPSALWDACAHDRPSRALVAAKRRALETACRCFSWLRETWETAEKLEMQMRTSLFYDREALWNLSRRLSTPISHPRDLNLTQIYEERMGHIHTATWKKIRGMLALVDEELNYGKDSEALVAQILRQAHALYLPLWDWLHGLGNSCLPNIFTRSCHSEHLPIFQLFPPVQGPPNDGQIMDFLGITTRLPDVCFKDMSVLLAPSRILECYFEANGTPLRNWPFLDEEYLEWADVLSIAAAAARTHGGLRVAEIGSGPIGLWGIRAAKAFVRMADSDATAPGRAGHCEVLLVEPYDLGDGSALENHSAANLPEGRCDIRVEGKPVKTSDDLQQLLKGKSWDLVDIDAQGAEHGMLRSLMPWLAQLPVQRLHVSTHARWIHRDIRRWLLDAGWVLLADSQALSLTDYPHLRLGPF
ncbi:unnamed protein product [Durusdinium trenchii]|uniref:Uncharacterized protein n=1 Tax=Durusdinium trenchii TaxID=1381693 RepID=A0ABP0SAM9_9DINO